MDLEPINSDNPNTNQHSTRFQSTHKDKNKGWCSSLIFLIIVLALIGVGGYYGFKYLQNNGYIGGEDTESQQETEEQAEEDVDDADNDNKDNETDDEEAINVKVKKISEVSLSKPGFVKVGTVFPKKEITVVAESQGTLSGFSVDEGEEVLKGELLGEVGDSISTSIAKINYDTAVANNELAKNSLANTKASVSHDVELSRISLNTANLSYENAVKSYNDLLNLLDEQSRASLIAIQGAELAFGSAQDSYSQTLSSHNLTFENTLQQSIANTPSALSLVESAIHTTEGYLESNFDNNIDNDLEDVDDEHRHLMDQYHDVLRSSNSDEIRDYLNDVVDLLEDTQRLVFDLQDEVEGVEELSSVEIALSSLITPLDQSKSGIRQGLSAVDGAVLQFTSQYQGTFNGVEMAEQQLTSARQALNINQAAKQQQITNALNGVDLSLQQLSAAAEQLESMKNRANLQIIGAETQANLSESQMKIAEENLGGTEIKAPMKGIVLNKYADEGNVVNPNQQVLTVGDMSSVKIIVSVTQEELKFIKLGQEVEIELPNGSVEEGIIAKVKPTLNQVSKKIDIEVMIDNKDMDLLSGMFVNVMFKDSQTNSKGIYVPFKSIIFDGSSTYVYLLNDDNKAHKKAVELGDVAESEVEITDGLEKGDIIIVEGAKLVEEGDAIQITE